MLDTMLEIKNESAFLEFTLPPAMQTLLMTESHSQTTPFKLPSNSPCYDHPSGMYGVYGEPTEQALVGGAQLLRGSGTAPLLVESPSLPLWSWTMTPPTGLWRLPLAMLTCWCSPAPLPSSEAPSSQLNKTPLCGESRKTLSHSPWGNCSARGFWCHRERTGVVTEEELGQSEWRSDWESKGTTRQVRALLRRELHMHKPWQASQLFPSLFLWLPSGTTSLQDVEPPVHSWSGLAQSLELGWKAGGTRTQDSEVLEPTCPERQRGEIHGNNLDPGYLQDTIKQCTSPTPKPGHRKTTFYRNC